MTGYIKLPIQYTMRGKVCKSSCPYFHNTNGWFCDIFGRLPYLGGHAPLLPGRHPKCIEAEAALGPTPVELTTPTSWDRIGREDE